MVSCRAGGTPKALVWDEAVNKRVDLPIIDRDFFLAGFSIADVVEGRMRGPRYARSFIFQAGQPAEITAAYREAMGIDRVEQLELAARSSANGATR